METQKTPITQSRRLFLKKAAYAAPAVVALGALTAPKSAHASIMDLSGPGELPGVTVTAKYDNVTNKYSDVTRSGKIGTINFDNNFVNRPGFRAWLKSIFGY